MSVNKSIRIKTTPGESKNIQFKIEQDFDTLDLLSLSITQEEVYRNFCSDYGVIAGRVIANDGFGVPNARVSIFIPLSDEDAQNPIISSIYPYVTPLDLNSQNIRYNLLPRLGREFFIFRNIPNGLTPQNFLGSQADFTPLGDFIGPWEEAENPTTPLAQPSQITNKIDGYTVWRRLVRTTNGPRVPVGTFPSKMELLNDDVVLEVYEKYYKFTTRTNNSGDYMIFGVPVGQQLLHLDVDLSDIGNTSLNPQDFINSGVPISFFTEDGDFQRRSNLNTLPQLETQNITVDVQPFWGNVEQCEIGITRQDFNLVKQINPSSILMFSCFGSPSDYFVRLGVGLGISGLDSKYSPNYTSFTTDTNQRQLGVKVYTRSDDSVYESVDDFDDGNVVLFIPMTKDRFITTETGNLELSVDPNVGIPTTTDLIFLVHPIEEFPNQIVGSNRLIGYGFYETKNIRMRYDLNNNKPRVYTIGQYNGVSTGFDLTINNFFGQVHPHPKVKEDGFIYGIRYGSIWFPRVRTGTNQNNTAETQIGRFNQPSTLFTNIEGFRYEYTTLAIERITQPHPQSYNPQPIVMDVTDVIGLWNLFGGHLTRYTSNLGSTYENQPIPFQSTQPYDPYGIDLRNHTIPLKGGKDNLSPVEFPETLNSDGSPWVDTFSTSPIPAYLGKSNAPSILNVRSSWNHNNNGGSLPGRYCFYWGVDPNNTVLHELKRRLFQ